MKAPRTASVLSIVLLAGCVSAGTYQTKVDELEQARKAAVLQDHEHRNQIAVLEFRCVRLSEKITNATRAIDELVTQREHLLAASDESTALIGELTVRLESLGQNVDRLAAEKGYLTASLEDARKRLEELRRQKLAAEERTAIFRMLAKKLHGMIDAGQLEVSVRNGRMLLVLPTDVLFDSGRTEIKADAREALQQVAGALASIEGRRYEIAGHTDDVPIHTRSFPSNWELSTQRAVEVTKFLIAHGLEPARLSAAGFGEYEPAAPNDSNEHRAQNRRIEITILPKLEELPSLDDLT